MNGLGSFGILAELRIVGLRSYTLAALTGAVSEVLRNSHTVPRLSCHGTVPFQSIPQERLKFPPKSGKCNGCNGQYRMCGMHMGNEKKKTPKKLKENSQKKSLIMWLESDRPAMHMMLAFFEQRLELMKSIFIFNSIFYLQVFFWGMSPLIKTAT